MRPMTDADFNKDSRSVLMKIEIYFDGIDRSPLTVTKEDYLLDFNITEESGADGNWPLGEVSANEIMFDLYNDDGLFNPTNTDSIYHDKIDTGMLIIPHIKIDDEEVAWLKLGEYFVTEWQASITGISAVVTATDIIQDFYDAEDLQIPIVKDVNYKTFYEAIFEMYGKPINVSPYFEHEIIPWTYMERDNIDLLQQATKAVFAICLVDRDGVTSVKHISEFQNLRATITDEDQVISADSLQSISKQYRGVKLDYSKPQITENAELLTLRNLEVKPGGQIHEKFTFSKDNMYQITNIVVEADEAAVQVRSYNATPKTITLVTTNNSPEIQEVNITIYGTVLEHIQQTLEDDESVGNILNITNNYIQTTERATLFKQILTAAVVQALPELTVPITGNPLLKIGDKIRVISEQYKLDYTGIIKQSTLRYDGGLSGELVLIHEDVFSGIMY